MELLSDLPDILSATSVTVVTVLKSEDSSTDLTVVPGMKGGVDSTSVCVSFSSSPCPELLSTQLPISSAMGSRPEPSGLPTFSDVDRTASVPEVTLESAGDSELLSGGLPV